MKTTQFLSQRFCQREYLGLPLKSQAPAVGLVVKLVVGVHDPAQVDPANLLRAAFVLQVLQQPVDDATHSTLIFQVVDILCGTNGEHDAVSITDTWADSGMEVTMM